MMQKREEVTYMKFKTKLLSTMTLAFMFSGCLSINMADTGMFDDLNDVKAHLAQGDDIDFQDEDGSTALMNSVLFGNVDNVKYLLEKGANINLKDKIGDTAFFELFIFDNPHDKEILDLLLAKGVNINQKDEDGGTALTEAMSFSLDKHVGMFLDKGADITILNKDGESPLSEICYVSKFEKAKKLIDTLVSKGVDLNLKDAEGDTLAAYTDCTENNELFTYLKSKGLK